MKRLIIYFTAIILCFSSFSSNLLFLSKANAEGAPILLGFKPNDTVADPNRPIVYMTKIGSKTLYAVNYETGMKTTLSLPYPAERLDLFNGKLYVTQHKMSHNRYNFGPYTGAIAEVDTASFTVSNLIEVEIDPYDIVVDKQGYIFISPGSGQWENLKIYSTEDHTEKISSNTSVYSQSYLSYNEEMSKVYAISTGVSPRDVTAHEVRDGVVFSQYDSPYHGDYNLEPFARISPDGENLYNNSGVVFGLSQVRSGDMLYNFELDQEYKDYAFSPVDELTFGANIDGGIDVFVYNSDEYLYSIKADYYVENLLYQNGGLVSIFSEDSKYYLEFIKDFGPEPFTLIDGLNFFLDEYGEYDWEEIYDGATDIKINGEFSLLFNHPVNIADRSKVSITGPEGTVPTIINEYDNELMIFPDKLKENTSYSLKIEKGAITGYSGMELAQDIKMNFKTFISPAQSVTVEVDKSLAPDQYTLNASAKDGFNTQYKFLINDNGIWKTLQDYSSNYSFVWKPAAPGGFSLKVMARSEGRTNPFDVEREFFVQVIDNKAPVVTLLKQDITSITNKNISLLLESSDNFSVKRIKLPNGEYVSDSKASYEVYENGLYEFIVEDTSGNTTAASIRVTNIDKSGPEVVLTPNILNRTRNNVSITITSTDTNGVKRIVLPDNSVILGNQATYTAIKNGTYRFRVEDTAGNISEKSIVVANIDKEIPKISLLPSSTVATRGNIYIAANASDNIKVKRIKLPNGSYVNGPTAIYPVANNGTYTFVVEDTVGNTAIKSIKIMNIDRVPPPIPTANSIYDSHTVITGKTVPNVTVYARLGSKVLGSSKTGSTGKFAIKIAKQTAGTKIGVVSKDPAGNYSKTLYKSVIDKTPPKQPAVNTVTYRTTVVKGKTEKYSIVYIYKGKSYVGKSVADSKGYFKVKIKPQKRGTTLSVYAIDKARNKSKLTYVKVK